MTVRRDLQTATGRRIAIPRLRGRFATRLATICTWLVREAIVEAETTGNAYRARYFREMVRPDGTVRRLSPEGVRCINHFLLAPDSQLPNHPALWGN